jgi:hypothetical protein
MEYLEGTTLKHSIAGRPMGLGGQWHLDVPTDGESLNVSVAVTDAKHYKEDSQPNKRGRRDAPSDRPARRIGPPKLSIDTKLGDYRVSLLPGALVCFESIY